MKDEKKHLSELLFFFLKLLSSWLNTSFFLHAWIQRWLGRLSPQNMWVEMPKISSLCIHFLSVIIVFSIASFETKVSHEGEIHTSLSTRGPAKRNGIITPERKEG